MNQKKGIGGILLIGGAALLVAAVLSVGVGSTATVSYTHLRCV